MKLGLISDVHADVHALRKALDLLDAHGADEILCAGDLVSFGHHPDETLTLMRERGVASVCGNHDRKTVRRMSSPHEHKLKAHHSDARRLRRANVEYLRDLPFSLTRRYGDLRLAVYHGAPDDDQTLVHPDLARFDALAEMLRLAGADVLVLGHTHLPMYAETPAGHLINPGAVLGDYDLDWVGSSHTCGLLDAGTLDYTLFDLATGAPDPRLTWPWWRD
ncbi:MAG: metallophosphoesterase family protein [Anaerolineae bacterium]|nr:metallophosphoesterase family protein [Anaerolineae bacterium]